MNPKKTEPKTKKISYKEDPNIFSENNTKLNKIIQNVSEKTEIQLMMEKVAMMEKELAEKNETIKKQNEILKKKDDEGMITKFWNELYNFAFSEKKKLDDESKNLERDIKIAKDIDDSINSLKKKIVKKVSKKVNKKAEVRRWNEPKQKIFKNFGKEIKYKTIVDLTKKLNFTTTQRVINNELTIVKPDEYWQQRDIVRRAIKTQDVKMEARNLATNEILEFKKTDNPLLLRNFLGIPKLFSSIKSQISSSAKSLLDVYDTGFLVREKNEDGPKNHNIKFTIQIRVKASGNDLTLATKSRRTISGTYNGPFGKDYKWIRRGFIMVQEGKEVTIDDNHEAIKYNWKFMDGSKNDQAFIDQNFKYYINNADDLDDGLLDIQKYKINETFSDYFFNDRLAYQHGYAEAIIIENVDIVDRETGLDVDPQSLRMFKTSYDDITTNLVNGVIEIKNGGVDNNCVVDFLKYQYPKINIDKYFDDKNINPLNGLTTYHLKDFCQKYSIKLIAYDQAGKIIGSYYPKRRNKSYKALVYISSNSHMYPLKNKYLNKMNSPVPYKEEIRMNDINQVDEKCRELFRERIIPARIQYTYDHKNDNQKNGKIIVKSFIHNKTLYYVNEDYDDCMKVLKEFGLEDKMTAHTTRYNLMFILEKFYDIPCCTSFFPQLKKTMIGGYRYFNKELQDKLDEEGLEFNIQTIDKNSAYSYAISQLKFVHTFDIRTGIVNDNPTKIIEDNLYIVKPKHNTILIPNITYCDGAHLIFCKNEGVEFELLKEFVCSSTKNYFKNMVENYFEKTKNIIFSDTNRDDVKEQFKKDVANVYYGKFEKGCDDVDTKTFCEKVGDEFDAECSNMPSEDYEGYKLISGSRTSVRMYTRKLLAFQVKNMSRRIVYEKMKKSGLTDNDVIYINTDSITYVDRNKNIDVGHLEPNVFDGWKLIDDVQIKNDSHYGYYFPIDLEPEKNHNILYNGYAGCGKSHYIINTVIPNLIENDKTFRVLSPSHSTIKEYVKANVPCGVIQKYEYHALPSEKVIIVDEIGLCNRRAIDCIYKLHLLGHQILCFGDFKQLLPVHETSHFNQPLFLDLLFHKKRNFGTNYRNNFTLEYYDSLINGKVDLIEELKRHRTNSYKDAEYVLCRSNESCKIFNDKMMKHLGIEFGDVGCKVMCKTNNLRDYGIFNNFIFTVTGKTSTHVILDNDISIPLKNFKHGKESWLPAYARTLYNIQGESTPSFYIPNSDLWTYKNDGRSVYTIISRLKQELIKKEQPVVENKKEKIIQPVIDIMETKMFEKRKLEKPVRQQKNEKVVKKPIVKQLVNNQYLTENKMTIG